MTGFAGSKGRPALHLLNLPQAKGNTKQVKQSSTVFSGPWSHSLTHIPSQPHAHRHYQSATKIQQRLDCNLLVVTSSHVILCQVEQCGQAGTGV